MVCNFSAMEIESKLSALIVLSATGGAAVVTCLVAVVLLLAARLQRAFASRLAMYHVLTGLVSAIACLCESLSVLYYYEGPDSVHAGCTAIAFLLHYSQWLTLCFTGWVIVHLVSYAVCHLPPKKLEAICVATSLILPGVVSSVPVVTGNYGLTGGWCWIKRRNECRPEDSEIDRKCVTEELALWYAPAAGMAGLGSVVVLAVVVILACRTYMETVDRNRAVLVIRKSTVNARKINQVLPLLVIVISWCLLVVPAILNGIYGAFADVNHSLMLASAFCTPAWSMLGGVTTMIHVILLITSRKSQGPEDNARYGSVEEDRDFTRSAVFCSTDSVNWSSSFRSSSSCELPNRNTASGHVRYL